MKKYLKLTYKLYRQLILPIVLIGSYFLFTVYKVGLKVLPSTTIMLVLTAGMLCYFKYRIAFSERIYLANMNINTDLLAVIFLSFTLLLYIIFSFVILNL